MGLSGATGQATQARRVVHCKREQFDVYIGRPSKWGNPYSHQAGTLAAFRVATRDEAIRRYREFLLSPAQDTLLAALPELRGKTLGCWCAPQSCHGDVLAELAEAGAYVVCGSREWPEDALWFVTAKMIELIPDGAVVITGGARGVDAHAHHEAGRLRRMTKVVKADWENYGKRAGFIRNVDMLKLNPRAVLAFQWANSAGTAHTIREAHKRGIPFHRFTEEDLRPDIAALDMGDDE